MFAMIVVTLARRFKCDRLCCRSDNAKQRNRNRHLRVPHLRLFISLCDCCVESKRGRIRRVKHWMAKLAILAAVFASLIVSTLRATDLTRGVVGHAGPLVGVGVALFEVKPNKPFRLVRQTSDSSRWEVSL